MFSQSDLLSVPFIIPVAMSLLAVLQSFHNILASSFVCLFMAAMVVHMTVFVAPEPNLSHAI